VDRGDNWSTVYSTTGMESFQSIYFINGSVGFAVSGEGKAFSTVNGGQTWEVYDFGDYNYLFSVFFVNAMTSYILGADGYGGVVYKTEDGGASWFTFLKDKTSMLSSVYFTDPQTGYIVGGDGLILKTTTGGTVTVNEPNQTITSCFSIYPNPAVDQLNISSQQEVHSKVTVSIINLSGQFLSENVCYSSQTIQIDLTGFPTGIYLVKIQTPESIETKKLLVLQ